MARKHVNINDLNENAVQNLSEDDLRKVTGGIAIIADYDATAVKVNYDYSTSFNFDSSYLHKVFKV